MQGIHNRWQYIHLSSKREVSNLPDNPLLVAVKPGDVSLSPIPPTFQHFAPSPVFRLLRFDASVCDVTLRSLARSEPDRRSLIDLTAQIGDNDSTLGVLSQVYTS